MNQKEAVISPQSIGKQQLTPESLFGGNTIDEAAQLFQKILRGSGTKAQNDVVAVNTGVAIHTIKPEQSLVDCIAEAEESLKSGRALRTFERLISLS